MIILKNILLYAFRDFKQHCNEQLWKNIAEIKSFLCFVLAWKNGCPKVKSVVICDVIICGDALDVAWQSMM